MTALIPIPFLDLKAQHGRIRDELDAAIDAVIDRGDFVKGSAIRQFESAFADYQAANECVAVANGTDALEISLEALGLPPNSEIIVPANTFIATSEAVSRSGHSVVFADVNDTYTLDPCSVEALISDRTSAVVAVHLYGQPADLSALATLCRANGLRLIEDEPRATELRSQARGWVPSVTSEPSVSSPARTWGPLVTRVPLLQTIPTLRKSAVDWLTTDGSESTTMTGKVATAGWIRSRQPSCK